VPEKDPTNYSYLTYTWVVLLSMWGGAVSFLSKYKEGAVRPFNFTEMIGELVTSGFIGVLTFWLCEWSNTPPLLSAAMIGVSGHMGSRAIFQLERWFMDRHLGSLKND
jgi:hypothetical protein